MSASGTLRPKLDDRTAAASCEVAPLPHRPAATAIGSPPRRGREWLHRYGPAEVLAVVASVAGYLVIEAATGSRAAGAYAAAVADTSAYYTVLLAREAHAGRRRAHALGTPYRLHDAARSLRALIIEFGPAEALDTALVRPACMVAATAALGSAFGILVAKLVADVAFYLPVVATYELTKRSARRAIRP
jgi:hypothetical protein